MATSGEENPAFIPFHLLCTNLFEERALAKPSGGKLSTVYTIHSGNGILILLTQQSIFLLL